MSDLIRKTVTSTVTVLITLCVVLGLGYIGVSSIMDGIHYQTMYWQLHNRGVPDETAQNLVNIDKLYYRSDGTVFYAPFIVGTILILCLVLLFFSKPSQGRRREYFPQLDIN